MPSLPKIAVGFALAAAAFLLAVIVESSVRSRFGGQMAIEGAPLNNTRVTGAWTPDFLWAGRAWSIEVQSDQDIELLLDGRAYVIPQGSHTIYSNHDRTNTGQYGSREFWGYPENIEFRPAG